MIEDNAACDHIIEQTPPVTALGVRFMTAPFVRRQSQAGDVFHVVAAYDNTEVLVGG